MQCAHCSTPIPDDARFCHSCGSQVSDAEGQARASASMDMSSFQHMEKLLKEDTEGEFEIQGMLGRGGMAVVFLAMETKLGRKVAIKVLPPELTFGHGVDRFMREAKTAALLDHPNIIPIYRIGSGSKLFWYAMKFPPGRLHVRVSVPCHVYGGWVDRQLSRELLRQRVRRSVSWYCKSGFQDPPCERRECDVSP